MEGKGVDKRACSYQIQNLSKSTKISTNIETAMLSVGNLDLLVGWIELDMIASYVTV